MEGIMFKITESLAQLRNLNPWTKCAVVFFLAATVLVISSRHAPATAPTPDDNDANSLSTFIPAGQRMVPIEILNSGALDSIIGRYGFVDLYLQGQKRPFARGVRIVKSIDGSGDWAALVSASLADELMAAGARFQVSVQSLKGSPNQSPIARERRTRTIVYEGN
jgi:hypothetical protein